MKKIILLISIFLSFFLFQTHLQAMDGFQEEIADPPFLDKNYVMFKYYYSYDSSHVYTYSAIVRDDAFTVFLNKALDKITPVQDGGYFQHWQYNSVDNTWSMSSVTVGLGIFITTPPGVISTTVDVYDHLNEKIIFPAGFGQNGVKINHYKDEYNEKNELTSRWYMINYLPQNQNEYEYQFSLGGEYRTHVFIDGKPSVIKVSSNTKLSARIIEKKTGNIIATSTIIVSDIVVHDIPVIKFIRSNPDLCIIEKNGEQYKLCHQVSFSVDFYNDINQIIYYSIDDGKNWNIYNPFKPNLFLFRKNTNLVVKVIDKNTNIVLTRSTYLINDISNDFIQLGLFVEKEEKFNNSVLLVSFFLYNYDNNLNNIYISYDGINYKLMNDIIHSNTYSFFKLNFEENTNVIVKITDKSGNFLYSKTFQINYNKYIYEHMSSVDKMYFQFKKKFGFYEQIEILLNDVIQISSSDEMPEFKITVFGVTVNIVDFTPFKIVRGTVHAIILFFAWFFFLRGIYYRIPGIINGIGYLGKGGRK